MKLALFNCRPYDRDYFLRCRDETHAGTIELTFYEFPLELKSMSLAEGHDAVCTFVNDVIDRDLLQALHTRGIDKLVLRCAGYNQVDLKAARELGFKIAHVPAYSPYAVAEHALALILTLNRKTHRAYNRVRDGNFSINGLLGFDIHGKAVGVIGMGIIGRAFADIMLGMNCRLTAYDVKPDPQMVAKGVEYLPLDDVLAQSDIVSLHCPLLEATHHLINETTLAIMKPGSMLINTSRGALIDTAAVIEALKSKHLGSLGIDVYEEESDLFFEDRSDTIIQDDTFSRLMTFPNVLITGHQAFFTHEALTNIAQTSLDNFHGIMTGGDYSSVL